jgi:hypothetical protein
MFLINDECLWSYSIHVSAFDKYSIKVCYGVGGHNKSDYGVFVIPPEKPPFPLYDGKGYGVVASPAKITCSSRQKLGVSRVGCELFGYNLAYFIAYKRESISIALFLVLS